jgi:hypothetical protein
MRAVSLIAALLLSGCGLVATQQARDPLGADTLLGHSIVDVIGCAGIPDARQRLGDEFAVAEWTYKSTVPGFKLVFPLLGSVQFGGGSQCKMTTTFLRDGTVVDIGFPGCTGTLFGGPYADARPLVGECLAHPNGDALPAGFDAFTYLFSQNRS